MCCTTFSVFVVAADLWALPNVQPFNFTSVGDSDMYRTSVVKRDGFVWPFFLSRAAYQHLEDFVRGPRSPDPKVIDYADNAL